MMYQILYRSEYEMDYTLTEDFYESLEDFFEKINDKPQVNMKYWLFEPPKTDSIEINTSL